MRRLLLQRCDCFAPPRRRALSTVVDALERRNLVAQLSSSAIRDHLSRPRTVYLGVDPTAPSLHLGNLATLLGLLHFQRHGHRVILLVGGATGAVGDPSGRDLERPAQSEATLASNIAAITAQLQTFFERADAYAAARGLEAAPTIAPVSIANNADWLGQISLVDFLSSVGRHARVSAMLARESVKRRLASAQGISYAEFTYNLLQAADFEALYRTRDCTVQLGGSDQHGNIMAGVDLVRRTTAAAGGDPAEVFGLTMPLLTARDGTKFGKSAGNAFWLDRSMTGAFELFQVRGSRALFADVQYLRSRTDAEVEQLLKALTLLPLDAIRDIMQRQADQPGARRAQTALAREVTDLIHGPDAAAEAEVASTVLFSRDLTTIRADQVLSAFAHEPSASSPVRHVARASLIGETLAAALCLAGLAKSRSDARRAIVADGSAFINGERVYAPDPRQLPKIRASYLIDDKVLVLGLGTRRVVLVVA